jgi:RND family efflux transporter MFP subunit
MKFARTVLAVVLVGAGFGGGFVFSRRHPSPAPAASERKILYYVDPMHPAYKSDKPGIAPDCGMKLVPVYADSAPAAAKSESAGLPPGAFQIRPEQQQLIGVRYGTAEFTTAEDSLRAAGRVALDETRMVRVHSKLDGWIESVHVDFTGAYVHKGDPLLTLYSPEMLASQKEYLLALRAREVLQGATETAVANSSSLVDASRRRLELWDLSRPQIEQLERTGTPIHSITVYSPAEGFVMSRNSFPSQRITPDTELYAIADLSRVWIMADVFESDLPKIHLGQTAMVSLPYQTGGGFTTRVNYIQPQVDLQTHTVKFRLESANPGLRLKPDMFVDVEFRISSTRQLTVPVEAVLDAGQTQTVFVDRGNGYLEPRHVEIGDHIGDRVVILKGLSAGERIVTSANFLVDSESRLKSAEARGGGQP